MVPVLMTKLIIINALSNYHCYVQSNGATVIKTFFLIMNSLICLYKRRKWFQTSFYFSLLRCVTKKSYQVFTCASKKLEALTFLHTKWFDNQIINIFGDEFSAYLSSNWSVVYRHRSSAPNKIDIRTSLKIMQPLLGVNLFQHICMLWYLWCKTATNVLGQTKLEKNFMVLSQIKWFKELNKAWLGVSSALSLKNNLGNTNPMR